jgi:hypothetical protein
MLQSAAFRQQCTSLSPNGYLQTSSFDILYVWYGVTDEESLVFSIFPQSLLLGMFARIVKSTYLLFHVSLLSVHLSTQNNWLPSDGFSFPFLLKSANKIQFWLNSDKNNGHAT